MDGDYKSKLDAFVAKHPDLKDEIDNLVPDIEQDPVNAIASALNSFSFSNQLPIFNKGDNFPTHCNRFTEHVEISKTPPTQQFALFLTSIKCDQTYALIRNADILDNVKLDHVQFLNRLKDIMYGDQRFSLRNSLLDCTQKPSETVSEYVFRLRQKAELAYPTNQELADDSCLMVFLRGLHDPEIRRKLNEKSSITVFTDAVREARNLERVAKQFNPNSTASNSDSEATGSILKSEVKFSNQSHSKHSKHPKRKVTPFNSDNSNSDSDSHFSYKGRHSSRSPHRQSYRQSYHRHSRRTPSRSPGRYNRSSYSSRYNRDRSHSRDRYSNSSRGSRSRDRSSSRDRKSYCPNTPSRKRNNDYQDFY